MTVGPSCAGCPYGDDIVCKEIVDWLALRRELMRVQRSRPFSVIIARRRFNARLNGISLNRDDLAEIGPKTMSSRAGRRER